MKVVTKENYRIVVYPKPTYRIATDEHMKSLCESIKREIKRHVDDVLEASVEWDVFELCSFCGLTMDEEESGEPMCCDKAQKEWKEK